jgi:hypothetical protein
MAIVPVKTIFLGKEKERKKKAMRNFLTGGMMNRMR